MERGPGLCQRALKWKRRAKTALGAKVPSVQVSDSCRIKSAHCGGGPGSALSATRVHVILVNDAGHTPPVCRRKKMWGQIS